MTTLDQSPLAPMLAHLFADATERDRSFRASFADMPPEVRHDQREFYTRAQHAYLPVSPEVGRLLYMLARAIGAQAIVEFGTSFAISTLHLAAALRDNGGGRLIGSELQPNKVAQARITLAEAGLAELVEIREGDAAQTLAGDLPDTIDLVLLDGHKPLYLEVLTLLAPKLRGGALILADNADMAPDYIDAVRADPGYCSVPLTAQIELTMRL